MRSLSGSETFGRNAITVVRLWGGFVGVGWGGQLLPRLQLWSGEPPGPSAPVSRHAGAGGMTRERVTCAGAVSCGRTCPGRWWLCRNYWVRCWEGEGRGRAWGGCPCPLKPKEGLNGAPGTVVVGSEYLGSLLGRQRTGTGLGWVSLPTQAKRGLEWGTRDGGGWVGIPGFAAGKAKDGDGLGVGVLAHSSQKRA